jgi:sugar/nucleoside kinase (ribokinase family)
MADVGCSGILVADTFCGPMKALPREGELLAVDSMPSRAGGCAANVAIDLARQGIAVEVNGCLGRDSSAGVIVQELESARVGCGRLVVSPDHPTSKTVILLVEGHDRRYIHTFGANAVFKAAHIPHDWLSGLKVFYLGGLFLMPAFKTDAFLKVLRFCRAHGVKTVVDVVIPKQAKNCRRDLAPLLPFIDVFLPNDDEAAVLTGRKRLEDQARALLDGGAGTVIVTRGRHGFLAARGKEAWRAGIYPMKVVDPSGSGDAFNSGVMTGMVRGWDLSATLRYAAAVGASAVRAVGTTTGVFSAKEAKAFVAAHTLKLESSRL